MRNIPDESWDDYKLRMYNRFERIVAWTAIILGLIIILIYMVYQAVELFLQDTATPKFLKIGIAAFASGLIILLFSIIREKIFTHKKDQYKEVQR